MLLTTIFYHVDNFCNEIKKHSRAPTKFIFNVYIDPAFSHVVSYNRFLELMEENMAILPCSL